MTTSTRHKGLTQSDHEWSKLLWNTCRVENEWSNSAFVKIDKSQPNRVQTNTFWLIHDGIYYSPVVKRAESVGLEPPFKTLHLKQCLAHREYLLHLMSTFNTGTCQLVIRFTSGWFITQIAKIKIMKNLPTNKSPSEMLILLAFSGSNFAASCDHVIDKKQSFESGTM